MHRPSAREFNADGIVGPTHNYAGVSPGNVASVTHGGDASNPRAAALQGLAKMARVHALTGAQLVLPPHPRPALATLRALGFTGADEQLVARAFRADPLLVRLCSSASATWTANAATVAPSADTSDARVHFVPANLHTMFHRALEAPVTQRVLSAVFGDARHFVVHDPLPAHARFADEGAANHTRLVAHDGTAVHLYAWGRTDTDPSVPAPERYPARQTHAASTAVARLHSLASATALFPQQDPRGIDAGAFHTDVLAVGHGDFLMLHELAFRGHEALLETLRAKLGPRFSYALARESELPAREAVSAYPFNSQLLTLDDGSMVVLAPEDSRTSARARAFLDRVVSEPNPVVRVEYVDVRESMRNGGGPACLRLRVVLTDDEVAAVSARVVFSDGLHDELTAWITRNYRDRLVPHDLGDPALARESFTALDELTQLLRLGSVYDFQR